MAVVMRHALRNALIPVVTLIGLQIGFLLGGAVVTETMFSWPGVGRLAVGAILPPTSRWRRARSWCSPWLPRDQPGRRRALRLSRSEDRATMSDAILDRAPDADAIALDRSGARTRSGAACCATSRRCLRSPSWSLVVLAAILAPWITPADPYANKLMVRFTKPWTEGRDGVFYLLGTDNQGRDMVTRLLFGMRSTLAIGVIAVLCGGSIGALIGLLGGLLPPARDAAHAPGRRAAVLPVDPVRAGDRRRPRPGLPSLVLALSIATVPVIARITRGGATVVMQQDYMEAGRAIGLGDAALIWRYLALNCVSTILVYMTLRSARSSCSARRCPSSASARSRRPPSSAAWPPTAASSSPTSRMSPPCRRRRSSSSCSPSTCWATRCATRSIRNCEQ